MLPSFRLVAATFFCGFIVVFAGLRMAASLNEFHEALPVMAAHAGPVTVSPAADREARRGVSSVPMMYDLRFAVSTAPTLIRATTPVFDRPAPPLAIVPSEDIAAEAAVPAATEAEPDRTEGAIAAVQPEISFNPAPVDDSLAAPLPDTAADNPPQQ